MDNTTREYAKQKQTENIPYSSTQEYYHQSICLLTLLSQYAYGILAQNEGLTVRVYTFIKKGNPVIKNRDRNFVTIHWSYSRMSCRVHNRCSFCNDKKRLIATLKRPVHLLSGSTYDSKIQLRRHPPCKIIVLIRRVLPRESCISILLTKNPVNKK